MNAADALLAGLKRLDRRNDGDADNIADELYPGWFDVVGAALAEEGYYIAPIRQAHVTPSRPSDPRTSHGAERAITLRAGTQRHRLLEAYASVSTPGLTDEEAMERAEGVRHDSEYAKRCSELREAGWIADMGTERKGSSGVPRIVCAITMSGLAELRRLSE